MKTKFAFCFKLGTGLAAALLLMAACADEGSSGSTSGESSVEDFYSGKTIRIIVGLDSGSGADLTARLVAKHLPEYIPGKPNVIVENVTGGGGIIAANKVYSTEPKDGTVIGTPLEGFPILQALGQEGIQFDVAQFQWIGSLLKTPTACMIRTDAGVNDMSDLMGTGKAIKIATTGPGNTTSVAPGVLNEALDTSFEQITGYAGSGEGGLALESGEVDAFCVSSSAIASSMGHLFEGDDPVAKIVVVLGDKLPNGEIFQEAELAEELTDDPARLEMLRAANGPSQMTRPYTFAPGVPEDRVEALREAFDSVMANPEFLSAAEAAGVEIEASTGAEVTDIVADLMSMSDELKEKLKEVYGIN